MTDEKTPADEAPKPQDEAPDETSHAGPASQTRSPQEQPVVDPRISEVQAVPSRAGSAGLWLALLDLLALLALGAAGFLAFQALQGQGQAQEQRLETQRERISDLELAGQGREQWRSQANSRLNETESQLQRLQRRQEHLSARQDGAESAISDLSERVKGGQNAWQRAEVEHLLLIANDRLQLSRDLDGATLALRLANERIAILSDPAYLPVREAIAGEISRLDAVPRVDLQAVALKLGSLAEQVQALPVRESGRGIFRAEAARSRQAAEQRWYEQAWVAVQEAIASLVTVRRDVERREPLLPPDQEFYLRQNLRLQLESARLAALDRDAASYNAALRQAESWLQTYFDSERAGARASLRTLRELQGQTLKPALPDISGSLRALRAVER